MASWQHVGLTRRRLDDSRRESVRGAETLGGQGRAHRRREGQAMTQDREQLFVEREPDLRFVHAPIPAILAHHAMRRSPERSTRPWRRRVRSPPPRCRRAARRSARWCASASTKVSTKLTRRRAKPLEIESVGEKLARSRHHHGERARATFELVKERVEACERIEVDAIFAVVPGNNGDGAFIAKRDVHQRDYTAGVGPGVSWGHE